MIKKRKVAIGAGLAFALAVAVPTAALAATFTISGTLNQNDADTYFNTVRSHSSGPASLRLTDNVHGADGGQCESQFGLYKSGTHTLVTNLVTFDGGGTNGSGGTGVTKAWKTPGGSSTIPAGNYAVFGHTLCAGGGTYYRDFSGVLTQ